LKVVERAVVGIEAENGLPSVGSPSPTTTVIFHRYRASEVRRLQKTNKPVAESRFYFGGVAGVYSTDRYRPLTKCQMVGTHGFPLGDETVEH
jgi:hypothetical protein